MELSTGEMRVICGGARRKDRRPIRVGAGERKPALSTVGIRESVNGSEVFGVAVEVPLFAEGSAVATNVVGSAKVSCLVRKTPRQAALNKHDGIDRPSLEQLAEALSSRDRVVHRKCEPMPYVEICVGIQFAANISVGIRCHREIRGRPLVGGHAEGMGNRVSAS